MKILFLCDRSMYEVKHSRCRYHQWEAIERLNSGIWWGPGWDGYDTNLTIQENIDKAQYDNIDLIVTYQPLNFGEMSLKNIKDISIPLCLNYNETWSWDLTIKEIDESGTELVIFHHLDDLYGPMSKYKNHYKNSSVKCVHIPHSAEKTIFKPMGLPKKYDVLVIGSMGNNYPFRTRLKSLLHKLNPKYKFAVHTHGGHRIPNAYNNHVAHTFAKVINESKICVTCSGNPRSRFTKYIEVPMCGTALAADMPRGHEDEFKNFLINIDMSMSDDEILNKLIFYIENDKERELCVSRGLKWSKDYTQEKYAQRFTNEAEIFLKERGLK